MAKNTPIPLDAFADDDGETTIGSNPYAVDVTEIKEAIKCLPKGKYNCSIAAATGSFAKDSNNPMITLRWKVEDGDFAGRVVFDRLVFVPDPSNYARQRIGAFCIAIGKPSNWKGELIPEDLIGERATLSVDVRADTRPTDDGSTRPDQNEVKQYAIYGGARSVSDLL